MPDAEHKQAGGGLSVQTLLVSSVSAVIAAVVVPTFWEKGSLIATAVTPVIVALVSEGLKKPAEAISTVPKVARRSATGAALRRPTPVGVGARGRGPEQLPDARPGERPSPRREGPTPRRDLPGDARVPPGGISPEDPFGLRGADRPAGRRRTRIAIVTGLLAAVIAAGAVTVSELAVFGHSVSASGRETSLFGGSRAKSASKAKDTRERQPGPTGGTTSPSATATPHATATATPAATATATPSATATPTPTPTATPTP